MGCDAISVQLELLDLWRRRQGILHQANMLVWTGTKTRSRLAPVSVAAAFDACEVEIRLGDCEVGLMREGDNDKEHPSPALGPGAGKRAFPNEKPFQAKQSPTYDRNQSQEISMEDVLASEPFTAQ